MIALLMSWGLSRALAWAVAIGVPALLLGALLLLSQCGDGNRQATEQARQTNRSGDAFANASASAIGTFENRIATDRSVDAAVANVQKEIGNAQDPDALRNAVLDGVCAKPQHRNDPACRVQ